MIVALMSTYREGALALSAARSVLPACDALIVFEGAVGEQAGEGEPTPVWVIEQEAREASVLTYVAEWEVCVWGSDAAKRTALLKCAQKFYGDTADPWWCLWIDGDEVLLWGEYLPDWVARAEHVGGAGGFALRIVEMDGSVAKSHGRIFRGDLVEAFEESSYQARLKTGMVVALPNIPICVSGGVPCARADGEPVTVDDLADLRPPLAGEPHILHRTILRSPARTVRRLHEDEPGWYFRRAGEQGIPYF